MMKFALVGCGRIAQKHAELLGKGLIPGARLAAVCDIVPERAREIGERYGVPWYPDMHQMMESEDKAVDAISILTESGLHAQHCLELVRYGKHLVVEKPMALTLDDADAMIHACDTAGVKLFIVKQNRYNVPVQKLRAAYEDGRLGKLIMGTVRVRWCRPQAYYDQAPWRGTWGMDGGVITNQASHHVDLLTWFMGQVDAVYAKGIHGMADVEVEDTAAVIIKFRSGALGVLEATTAVRPRDLEASLTLMGSGGSVEIGGKAVNQIRHWNFVDERPEDADIQSFSENPPNVYGFGHRAFYVDVVDCIEHNKKQLIDGLEGRKSLEVISAIYESMETRKEIYLRFKPEKCKLGARI